MNRTNLPEQMGYANGGDVDPEDFLAKADTLSTADRTRMMDGEPFITHADSVYSVVGRSPSMSIARQQAQAMMRRELAQREAKDGLVQGNVSYWDLARLPGEVRRAEDNPSLYEFEQHYSPDMRRQLMAKMFGTEGRAAGGLIDGYAGGGIYTMPHLAQMAGGGIYTIPMAGGGMYVPGYGLGGFFRGLSKVASAASFIPGLQAFSIPIAAASGAIGGAMDGGGIQGALKGGAGGFIGAKAGQALGGLGGAASKGADIASKAGTLAKGADVASKAGQLAKGVETAAQGASTLSKILDIAQHPAMMAMGYPLLGELLGSVGGGGLGKMGEPTSSRGGESIQRVMPSYVADRQATPTRAQGYTGPIALQSRQRGGMMEEEGEMGIPDFTPQPVRPRRPIPEYTAPVIERRPDLNIDRPVRPDLAPPSEERREETSEIEDRFENVEREVAPREDRRGRRERPEDRRERGPREGGGDLSGTEERTTRDAEPEGRGTSYEEGRYRYGDRMTEEQKRMAERFETQDEFGDADESAEIENIRAIAKGTPSDDIVSIDGTMIEGESPYDDSPTSMPGGRAPVVVGSSTGQFTPQAHEIMDAPYGYRAGLMSERPVETGQLETFLGQDPFSVFAGQQQDPISMFRGPAAPQAPLQMPNMPFLQQGPAQMGPPPPMIAGPGDKFSRPRIEAPRRVVPAEQQMQSLMQMPQPMQQMPVGRMLPPEQRRMESFEQRPGGPGVQGPQMQPSMQMQPRVQGGKGRGERVRDVIGMQMPQERMQPSMQMPQERMVGQERRMESPQQRPGGPGVQGGLGGLRGRKRKRSTRALEGRADGGMAPQDIPFEGFIEPFEDGTMESSGAVDDRVAVMKPNLSEVGPEQMEMLSALKNALRNPTSEVSRQIIELARNTFGEKFITNLMEDMLSAGNNPMVESQDDMDRLVEMEFRGNLAEGGPVRVGAAIAPNEYVLTASQVRNVGGGNTEEGARRIKKLARNIDIAGSKTDGPLNVEIA